MLEDTILTACAGTPKDAQALLPLVSIYGWDELCLETELLLLSKLQLSCLVITDFVTWWRENKALWSLYPIVGKILLCILVLPASNAVSERSFSTLRRVLTHLRNRMNDEKLNAILMLHIHKNLTNSIDLQSIIRQFVQNHPHRKIRIAIM